VEEKLLEDEKRKAGSEQATSRSSGFSLLAYSPIVRRYGWLVLLILLALAPLPLSKSTAIVRVLDLIAIYSLLALGLNVVVGFAGLLDLGYVAFYAVGAYSYAFLASPQFNIHWPFLLTLAIGAGVAAIFGILLGIPVLRLRGDYLAIVTLGFGEMIRIFLNNLDVLTNGPKGISMIDAPNIFGYRLTTPTHIYYLLLVLLALSILFLRRLETSRIGRAWAAIREDEGAARAMGINTTRLKLTAFSIGATTAGLAGVVFSGLQGFVSPESFIFWESITILSMIVLGGIGSVPGVIVGAITLIGIPELLRQYADYRQLFFGAAMILMMVLRPQGIWPSRIVSAELRKGRDEEEALPEAVEQEVAAGAGGST
jgi:branched-chain amino acid transport system permease protein